MLSSCVRCALSALCVQQGGPNAIELHRCAACKTFAMFSPNGEGGLHSRILPHLECHRQYIVYEVKVTLVVCPNCGAQDAMRRLSFV